MIVLAALFISACSGGAPKGIEIAEVVFAKELSENFEPVDSTEEFFPDETINVSVRIPGRPREGVLAARFLYMNDLIAETSIDFGQENSDLLFSVGQDTFTGFYLTHDDPSISARSIMWNYWWMEKVSECTLTQSFRPWMPFRP